MYHFMKRILHQNSGINSLAIGNEEVTIQFGPSEEEGSNYLLVLN
jgi:hypothetical protein